MGIFNKIASLILGDSGEQQSERPVPKPEPEMERHGFEKPRNAQPDPEHSKTEECRAEKPESVEPKAEEPVAGRPDTRQSDESDRQGKNTVAEKLRQGIDKLDNNYIEASSKIIDTIEKKLNVAYKGKNADFSKKNLTLWITEALLFETLDTDEYKAKFRLALSQEGYDFNNYEFRCMQLPEGSMFTPIADSVFMQITDKAAEPVKIARRKARITLVPGSRGSLKAAEYILDSENMPNGGRFNIGRGTQPMPTRTNYIVIDENPDAKDYSEVNGYISRTHATIRFSPSNGFCLFVESGSYQNGSRTRVFREGEPEKDLTNPQAPVPLRNGDVIELAKKMTLLFEEIDD